MKTALPHLRRLRESQLLTQQMLADRAGVEKMTVSRLERGGCAYPSTVYKLAAALNVEPQMLVRTSDDIRTCDRV